MAPTMTGTYGTPRTVCRLTPRTSFPCPLSEDKKTVYEHETLRGMLQKAGDADGLLVF